MGETVFFQALAERIWAEVHHQKPIGTYTGKGRHQLPCGG